MHTPWDTVVCFTYKLNVYKTNNHTELVTDVETGSANLTVINTVGKKLPVTGSSVMLLMLGAGTVLVGFSYARLKKNKKDSEQKQGE